MKVNSTTLAELHVGGKGNWISRLGRYLKGEGGGVPGQGWRRGWAGWRWLGTVYVNVLCDLKARMGAYSILSYI